MDHATAGAVEAFHVSHNIPVALAIAGHHGGIPDLGNNQADTADDPTFCGRIKRKVSPDPVWRQECPPPASQPPVWLSLQDFPSIAFYTRMLYSCLVDGDFQDTQNFMNGTPPPRGQYASLETLLSKVHNQASRYLQATTNSTVCQQRNGVLQSCLEKGQSVSRGLYTLTVPTGGGKTFASLAFGLEHVVRQGMSRIIYVIPYTSIIDQTAEVFTRLLGEENVLPHRYGAEYQLSEPEELSQAQYKKFLASENWDAPVVVTTSVQFFESLYSNRSSRCRKLHNIANSVIIFDEAQTLPVDYLRPCLCAIGELVRHYRATAVLCAATQPALEPLFRELAPIRKTHPLIKGVLGAQSSGASLVSFNGKAFESYGHEQDANASVGEYAAFAYTTALNTLHRRQIGDATVVCWAENARNAAADLGIWALFEDAEATGLQEEDVSKALSQLAQGQSCQWAEGEITRGRAAILKAYYTRNEPNHPIQEVLTVELNEQSNYLPYVLGRIFSVLEAIQSAANPNINTTIKDRYFNSACATPGVVFPTLIKLAQKHLQKLDTGSEIYYGRQLTELMGKLSQEFPARMTLPEQGAFEIGYYHQTQKRFEKKN